MRVGLRLQLLLALGVLLVMAFVPLHFAVAGLAEASLAAARREAARELGRAVSGHALSAHRRSPQAVAALLDAQLSDEGVLAIGLYGPDGERGVAAGDERLLPERVAPRVEATSSVRAGGAEGVLVVVPGESATCATVVSVEPPAATRSPLVGLLALYTGIIALALLVFAYFALTRLVVRPVGALSQAAGRVAGGARSLDIPASGARELRELAESIGAMMRRLLDDERALRAKVTELERTTSELESAHETVIRSERLASVGRLAAGMAHEIGNPLAALVGLEELLLGGDLTEEERRDVLERMKRETERIHRVLRDLLDFARTHEIGETASGEADVASVVERTLALVAPQKAMRDVETQTDLASDLPHVGIADERLQQVLLNLLMNAADAVPRPGGTVSLRARAERDAVVLTVDDNGTGIDEDVLARIFEPFVTTKEVGKGTGLGLAVCRGLIEAAGGTIDAGRSPQGGARFTVRLPRAAPASRANPAPRATPAS